MSLNKCPTSLPLEQWISDQALSSMKETIISQPTSSFYSQFQQSAQDYFLNSTFFLSDWINETIMEMDANCRKGKHRESRIVTPNRIRKGGHLKTDIAIKNREFSTFTSRKFPMFWNCFKYLVIENISPSIIWVFLVCVSVCMPNLTQLKLPSKRLKEEITTLWSFLKYIFVVGYCFLYLVIMTSSCVSSKKVIICLFNVWF